jgi:AcrR family transcriptional regulator
VSSAASPDSPVRPRNPRGQGAQLRDDIVAAAGALLDEGGDDAVTLRGVARRIGISAPSIYAHFADRDAILLAVAREAFAELADHLAGAAGSAPAAHLRAVCAAYLEFAQIRPSRYRVMFGGVWDAAPAVHRGAIDLAQVQALGQEALAVLGEALRRCVADGIITSTDPAADTVMLWVGLHGLAHQRLVASAFPWPQDIDTRLIAALTGLPVDAAQR